MKNSRIILTAVLVVIMVLLAIDIAIRLGVQETQARAGNKIEYKVVSFEEEEIMTGGDFEGLLNDMSNKGWTYHEFVFGFKGGFAVLKKE